MDADVTVALAGVYQRLSALEAGAATANSNAAASAMQVAQASSSMIAEQEAFTQQARLAAISAAVHPGFIPAPGWRPGMPYPGHPYFVPGH